MTDFIDRAKLEALAEEYAPDIEGHELLRAHREVKRDAFLAGAAVYAALLDAETTEEWGVDEGDGIVDVRPTKASAQTRANHGGYLLVSRRAICTPWLPSEGGES